jgi:hypothetical protein
LQLVCRQLAAQQREPMLLLQHVLD